MKIVGIINENPPKPNIKLGPGLSNKEVIKINIDTKSGIHQQ